MAVRRVVNVSCCSASSPMSATERSSARERSRLLASSSAGSAWLTRSATNAAGVFCSRAASACTRASTCAGRFRVMVMILLLRDPLTKLFTWDPG